MVDACRRRVRVELADVAVADSTRARRVLETSHPPTIYVPPEDVRGEALVDASGSGSLCEYKGAARYFDVIAGGGRAERAAWSYPRPDDAFAELRDWVAFYPGRVACFLDAERVRPQEGGFYGGWITDELEGPFKGGPGTFGW
jgi:uncharacterized protein (DUF427 family)